MSSYRAGEATTDDASLSLGPLPRHRSNPVYEPSQQEWNAFAAQVVDPDGHLWMIMARPNDWTA